jgi:hypothetical protein
LKVEHEAGQHTLAPVADCDGCIGRIRSEGRCRCGGQIITGGDDIRDWLWCRQCSRVFLSTAELLELLQPHSEEGP